MKDVFIKFFFNLSLKFIKIKIRFIMMKVAAVKKVFVVKEVMVLQILLHIRLRFMIYFYYVRLELDF